MIDTKKEQEREELHRAIWAIADELRGAVDGWDFKNYVLGTMVFPHGAFVSRKAALIENGVRRASRIGNFHVIVFDEMRGPQIYALTALNAVYGIENHRTESIGRNDGNIQRLQLTNNILVVRRGTENQTVAPEFRDEPYRFQLLFFFFIGIKKDGGEAPVVCQPLYGGIHSRIVGIADVRHHHHDLHGALHLQSPRDTF